MRSMSLNTLVFLTVLLVAGIADSNPVAPVRCGWEDGGTVLGMSGTGIPPIIATSATVPEPVFTGNYSLRLMNVSPIGVPLVYVAALWNLDEGNAVTISFMRYLDPLGDHFPCLLWGHWNDFLPGNLDLNTGDAGGTVFPGANSGWEEVSHTWTVEGGHTGLVIELHLQASVGATVWIDDLDVLVMQPRSADCTLQTPCFTIVGTEKDTWGTVKSLFR